MIDAFHHPLLMHLSDDLWPEAGLLTRSAELTPLYVDRFHGPRIGGVPRPHPFWELGAVKEGSGELDTVGTRLALRPGMVFLIPPGLPHTEIAAGNIDITWVGLRGSLLDEVRTERALYVVSEILADRVESLWIAAVKQRIGGGPELDGLARTLTACFIGMSMHDAGVADSDRIGDLALYLRQHLAEPARVETLARRMGCSVGHMRRMFKARTGSTPAGYLAHVRIEHALRLLEHSNLPIADVARLTGYEDPFYFCRVFQKTIGTSPLKYRKIRRPSTVDKKMRNAVRDERPPPA
jgi:AraC-like DNA-binding protein